MQAEGHKNMNTSGDISNKNGRRDSTMKKQEIHCYEWNNALDIHTSMSTEGDKKTKTKHASKYTYRVNETLLETLQVNFTKTRHCSQ